MFITETLFNRFLKIWEYRGGLRAYIYDVRKEDDRVRSKIKSFKMPMDANVK